MDRTRLYRLFFLIEQETLTPREEQFIETVKRYFLEHGSLTEQQESILKGIYRGKIWIRKSFFNQNHLPKDYSLKPA